MCACRNELELVVVVVGERDLRCSTTVLDLLLDLEDDVGEECIASASGRRDCGERVSDAGSFLRTFNIIIILLLLLIIIVVITTVVIVIVIVIITSTTTTIISTDISSTRSDNMFLTFRTFEHFLPLCHSAFYNSVIDFRP